MGSGASRTCGFASLSTGEDVGKSKDRFELEWPYSGEPTAKHVIAEIPRMGDGQRLKALKVVVELGDISRVSNTAASLVLLAEKPTGSGYAAPAYTSFGAWARANGIKLSKGKPAGSKDYATETLAVSKLNYHLKDLGALFLAEVESPRKTEALVRFYASLKSMGKALVASTDAGSEIVLPLVGYGGDGDVPIRSAVQEGLSFAYEMAQTVTASLEQVRFVVPNRTAFDRALKAAQLDSRTIEAVQNMRPDQDSRLVIPLGNFINPIAQWIEVNKQEQLELHDHLNVLLDTYNQHKDKPYVDVRAQFLSTFADVGVKVANHFVEQWHGVGGFEGARSLASKARFLRFGQDSDDTAYLTQKQYDGVETLRRIGETARDPVACQYLTDMDGAFCLAGIIYIIGSSGASLRGRTPSRVSSTAS